MARNFASFPSSAFIPCQLRESNIRESPSSMIISLNFLSFLLLTLVFLVDFIFFVIYNNITIRYGYSPCTPGYECRGFLFLNFSTLSLFVLACLHFEKTLEQISPTWFSVKSYLGEFSKNLHAFSRYFYMNTDWFSDISYGKTVICSPILAQIVSFSIKNSKKNARFRAFSCKNRVFWSY